MLIYLLTFHVTKKRNKNMRSWIAISGNERNKNTNRKKTSADLFGAVQGTLLFAQLWERLPLMWLSCLLRRFMTISFRRVPYCLEKELPTSRRLFNVHENKTKIHIIIKFDKLSGAQALQHWFCTICMKSDANRDDAATVTRSESKDAKIFGTTAINTTRVYIVNSIPPLLKVTHHVV